MDINMNEWATWLWRLGITAVLLLTARLYLRGWRHSPERQKLLSLLAFLGGLGLSGIVLASPFSQLAYQFFYVRVAQDLLLAAWIPGLLLAANPLPILWRGLSAKRRDQIRQFFRDHSGLETKLRAINAGAAWLVFVSSFWFWYDGRIHQATLQHSWIRPLQIFSLFLSAFLYWWHITGALPYFHNPMPRLVRIFYAIAGAWAIKGVGLILLFSPHPPYQYPSASQPLILGFADYSLGTIIMWLMGGIAYSTTATFLMRGWLEEEEVKPAMPVSVWSSDDAFIAPGFGQSK